eukprot:1984739-Pyramimonas_sp.AAC.1
MGIASSTRALPGDNKVRPRRAFPLPTLSRDAQLSRKVELYFSPRCSRLVHATWEGSIILAKGRTISILNAALVTIVVCGVMYEATSR